MDKKIWTFLGSNFCLSRNDNIFSEGPDSLSWSSVQIHCQCTVSESRVYLVRSHQLSTEEVSTTACDTSFVPSKGERGMTVLSTKPKILFCDMRLDPGESKTCKSLAPMVQINNFLG